MRPLASFGILFIMTVSLCFSQGKAGDWEITKDKDGIVVYTRPRNGGKLKETKTISDLKGGVDAIAGILKDYAKYKDWVDRTKESDVLKRPSSNEYIVYFESASPWPVSNRDLVLRVKVDKMSDKYGYIFNQFYLPHYIPEKESIVRMADYDGHWEVSDNGDGTTHVVYYMFVDPGGNIPDWTLNMVTEDAPYKTLENLRNLVEGN